MSTPNLPVYVRYIGNETATEFSVTFPYIDKKYVKVYLARERTNTPELLDETRYSFVNDTTIKFPVKEEDNLLGYNDALIILRKTDLGSDYDFDNQCRLFPEDVMNADDLAFQQIQELAYEVSRAVKTSIVGEETADDLLQSIYDAKDKAYEAVAKSEDISLEVQAFVEEARIWATGEDAEVENIAPNEEEHSSRGYADLSMAIANTPEDVPVSMSNLLALNVIRGPKGPKGDKGDKGDTFISLDSEISDTSENGVQNKVVKAYADTKVSKSGDVISGDLELKSGSLYLESIGGSVGASKSKLVLGTPNNEIAYLTGNSSGAFGIYSDKSGTRNGVTCYPASAFFADATTKTIDLGRNTNVWKVAYINKISDGTNIANTSDIISGLANFENTIQDVRSDFMEADSELQTQINGQAEAIANKVDKDEADYVVESYTNGTDWYRVYKSGWIEQGGVVGADVTSGYPVHTVTLLQPMLNTDYNVQVTGRYNSSTNEGSNYCSNRTTTSIQIVSIGYGSYWTVTGYAK